MFVRPLHATVTPADRPAGRPLLRGLLTRAAGPPPPGLLTRAVRAAEPPSRPEPPSAGAEPGADDAPEPPQPTAVPGAEPGPGPPSPATGPGLAADLAQLAALAREGLLTPDEFTAAKARLLHP
ncbi:hypothetical protein ACFWUQ_04375 [Streptomyces sp. NPDC058662]|uniref:hypothetical protein n=1 Tax=Streptomyces sp. NPDC058662 TaxID=3346583 RepID=UPI003667878C